MNICFIGSGYVGLVTGTCFAEFGVKVTCVDTDEKKIEGLKKFTMPIYEPGLEEMVRKNVKEERLSFTTDLAAAIKDSLVIFIAVGTPPKEDGSADLSYIESVACTIAKEMNGYKVIVTKSTVPVGTGQKIREIIEKNQVNKIDFDIVSNPEFLREGSAISDFMRPNRIVIGASSSQAVAIMKDLYRPLYLIETPIIVTDIASSELIKYASNAFLATKISFINEIANLCEKVGADVHMVAKGMGLDGRIGSKFLHPGPGYGGSCFPKDTLALIQIGKDNGYDMKIINSVVEVNKNQLRIMVEKVKNVVRDFKGKVIGILGLSFKPNTDDMRDAPSIYIIEELQRLGARIKAYDPVSMDASKNIFKNLTYCKDSYDVADGSDALLIITEWNQFRNIDLEKIKGLMNTPLVIDMRNIYEPQRMKEKGFNYICVGRPSGK